MCLCVLFSKEFARINLRKTNNNKISNPKVAFAFGCRTPYHACYASGDWPPSGAPLRLWSAFTQPGGSPGRKRLHNASTPIKAQQDLVK